MEGSSEVRNVLPSVVAMLLEKYQRCSSYHTLEANKGWVRYNRGLCGGVENGGWDGDTIFPASLQVF